MADPFSPPPSQQSIENLLRSLTGIVSARVVLDDIRGVSELHVLATSDLHPKQVVRNIESALRAGLGVEIDRRVVSVAQVEGGEAAEARPSTAAPPGAPDTAAPAGRVVFVGFEAERLGERRARCSVTLSRDDDRVHGAGDGPDTPQGRAEAAARAAIQALANASGRDNIGLEGARVVETESRRFVLVAAQVMDRRPPVPLSGAALLERSPEEAAIMATLQATNRWSGGP